LITY